MSLLKNKKLNVITLLSAALLSFSAWAISLDDAKNQGLVGEDSSGYLGLVVQNAEAKAVVDEINAKRKAQYLKLAIEWGHLDINPCKKIRRFKESKIEFDFSQRQK